MKKFTKLLGIVLIIALVMSMGIMAWADGETGGETGGSGTSTPAASTGTGSITVTNAEIGATYTLYKLFDATVAADGSIAYSLPSGKDVTSDTFFNQYFEVKNGNVIAKDTFTSSVVAGDGFKTWAASFGTQVAQTEASTGTVEFNSIDYGYYYVKSSVGAVLTVDSANPHADVIDKNQTVKFDKNIVSGQDLVKMNEAGLNIDVPFDITVSAKNYDGTDKVFKYVIYDTLEPGWTLKAAPVVKIADATKTAGTEYTIAYYTDSTKATAAKADLSDAQYFEITIPWTSDGTKDGTFLYNPNDKINVTYTAKLDPEKAANVGVGNNTNDNTADVKYFKGPDTTTPSGDLPDVTTKTYETKLTITKTDGNSQILTGAEFTLTSTNGTKVSYVYETKYVADDAGTYYELTDGTYTDEAPTGDATHDAVYKSTTAKYKLVTEAVVKGEGQTNTAISSYVGADGTVTFSGLGAGTYKIEETVVPAGYNKADDIEFTISFAIDKTDPTNPVGEFSSNNAAVVLDGTNNVFKTTIINRQGTELPSTGGIGTTIFYVVGSILVVAAGVLLITKKRMSREG